jgi:hypothetical protein
LVERQLCKLDVRGSNPLASISKEMKAEMRTDGSTGGARYAQGLKAKPILRSQAKLWIIPLPPVFTRHREAKTVAP